MATNESSPTAQSIATLATKGWGLHAEVTLLGGWEDSNYRLRTDDGRTFVLKVAPSSTRTETLENQAALLEHLASSELAPLVPCAVATKDGRLLHQTQDREGTARWARLLTYLEGQRLLDVDERPPRLLDEIGRTLARLDLSLKTFDHPATRSTHEWDVMAVGELIDLARHIDDSDRRSMVEAHLQRFSSVAPPRREELEHGVIHADANDHNLLVKVDGSGPRLSGIIDFSDALISPIIADLGISLAYLMLDRDDPHSDAGHLIRGYHTVRPLTGLERELLPDLVLARICASVLHAAHGLSREPDNAYLQISAEPMWRLLERLVIADVDRFPETVETACS